MTKHNNVVARLALTLGEPAGIGPDVCVLAAQQTLPAEVIVVGSPELLLSRAKTLNLPLELYEWNPSLPIAANGNGRIGIVPVPLEVPCVAGTLDKANARYVLACLDKAHSLCMSHDCQALVTGPVQKSIIHDSGVPFAGHTEYLAALAGVDDVLMTFYTPETIVAMLTTHLPLKEVSAHITAHRLTRVIEILDAGLKQLFNISHPTIHVCGLNPHAGENGLLGNEEQAVIVPTLETLRAKGYNLKGPVPGDTAFTPSQRQEADAIVAMFHDQGLAPIKALYFEQIVNVTMGLPYLRTSVDHGTALSLAGTGKASHLSLTKAIELAAQGALL